MNQCSSCSYPVYVCKCNNQNKRGCLSILFDLFMIVITGGLWIIWILIREIRNG